MNRRQDGNTLENILVYENMGLPFEIYGLERNEVRGTSLLNMGFMFKR